MADFNQINQFGSAKPFRSGEGMNCAECEAMLTDAIDNSAGGVLSAKDRAAFDLHIASCKECSQMLADVQRGAALLEMLKSYRPEPPASLIDRIIAQTSGQISVQTGGAAVSTGASQAGVARLGPTDHGSLSALPVNVSESSMAATFPGVAGNVIPFRARPAGRFNLRAVGRTLMQPRLAMTAAMAFFSIALTLNLTGVHVNELRASDLKPSSLKHTFYQADASLVRYYENLRVVYELETRLNDLKQSSDGDGPAAKPNSKASGSVSGENQDTNSDKNGSRSGQQRKPTPKAGSGTSQRSNPLQPEFKLVEYPVVRHSNLTQELIAADWIVLTKGKDELKEVFQEGGSV